MSRNKNIAHKKKNMYTAFFNFFKIILYPFPHENWNFTHWLSPGNLILIENLVFIIINFYSPHSIATFLQYIESALV